MAIFRKKNVANVSSRAALPPQLANLLRESWWLLLVGLLIYLVLALTTYNPTDPGWSRSASHGVVHNRAGTFGAIIADLLLYLFGLSAWWWVVFCFGAILWGYRRIDRVEDESRHIVLFACIGFIVLLLASSCLEALRLHSMKVVLPLAPGGIFGLALAGWLNQLLGFSGATLALVVAFGLGISLFSNISWLNVMENLGAALEFAFFKTRDMIQTANDRRIGRQAAVKREERVVKEKKEQVEKPPIRIEPQHLDIPVAKAAAKAFEKHAEEEKKKAVQPTLFDLGDIPLPNCSSMQPPITLLAPPLASQETISLETLEYTSRLIEKKLAEFNVAVKVIAAYPGPVITRYEIEPAVGVKGAQIVNLMRDLARALGLVSIRVVETIPGKTCMGLELPNPTRQTIRLSEILSSETYHQHQSKLTIALGKDITGRPLVTDLARAPHMLVAGTTG